MTLPPQCRRLAVRGAMSMSKIFSNMERWGNKPHYSLRTTSSLATDTSWFRTTFAEIRLRVLILENGLTASTEKNAHRVDGEFCGT